MPGDRIKDVSLLSANGLVQIGTGLTQSGDEIVAVQPGVIHWMTKVPGVGTRAWVDCNQKRYAPCLEDMVLGIVTDKHADDYKIDIRSSCGAILPALSFEGATKRSRPRLNIGATVYARVCQAIRDCEPELTCVCLTSKKGWMTGQAIFGELEGGHMFDVGIGYSRSLLDPNCPVINLLGKHIPFEVAVGVNGRVWVKSASIKDTILIVNAVKNAEHLQSSQVAEMVTQLVRFNASDT
eukprot:CAMPEP_0169466370 /NCGR_PEP_ID=MMETSP1042-20121227/21731_1 /TAXON_ID=464988 /ORGANISM="Hemiselmis andersenii, Strain CCMP1180" /LENGTH=237 /DNA_ID=CAMNT_0009579417 /DNA_START=15 /DNA_END=728 /DNA_ORIENTATION=+